MTEHYQWPLNDVKGLSVRERSFWIDVMNARIERKNAQNNTVPESMHG